MPPVRRELLYFPGPCHWPSRPRWPRRAPPRPPRLRRTAPGSASAVATEDGEVAVRPATPEPSQRGRGMGLPLRRHTAMPIYPRRCHHATGEPVQSARCGSQRDQPHQALVLPSPSSPCTLPPLLFYIFCCYVFANNVGCLMNHQNERMEFDVLLKLSSLSLQLLD